MTDDGRDAFENVARHYDGWIGWDGRLKKEMPFLLDTLAGARTLLDVGCGTGVHALALAREGFEVTALDCSPAMLAEARVKDPDGAVRWVEGRAQDPTCLEGASFDGVLALGNALLTFGTEEEVLAGLEALVGFTRPGGTLICQWLNIDRIRAQGRLVTKTDPATGVIWIRHHVACGDEGPVRMHSYTLTPEGGAWRTEAKIHELAPMTGQRVAEILAPVFAEVQLFDSLSGGPFDPLESDTVGLVARDRRPAHTTK